MSTFRSDPPPTILQPGPAEPRPTLVQGTGGRQAGLKHVLDELLNRFEIDEELPAKGSEADLFVMHLNDRPDERRLVKIYRKGIKPNPEVLEIVSKAPSDHVVRVLEYKQVDGRWYEVQEYIAHGSLRDLMKDGRLPDARLREVVKEIANALSSLHQLQLVHCDLKPDNILVRANHPLDLVITDFGIAAYLQGSSRFSRVKGGTLEYAPPEWESGHKSEAFDYWSFGIMVAELAAGKHPFASSRDANAARFTTATNDVPLKDVPETWRQLCRGLLVRNPDHRWKADEVGRWLAGEQLPDPVAASPQFGRNPLRVGGIECLNPSTLARAITQDWEAGGRLLVNKATLQRWIGEQSFDLDLISFIDQLDAETIPVDAKIALLVARMNPELPPVLRRWTLDESTLASVASLALAEDAEAAKAIQTLWDANLLRRHHELSPTSALLARIHGRWADVMGATETRQRQLVQQGATVVTAHQTARLATVLLALLSNDAVVRLRRDARDRMKGDAKKCGWYRGLGKPASADLPALVLMVELAPAAELQARLPTPSGEPTPSMWRPLLYGIAAIGALVILMNWFSGPERRSPRTTTQTQTIAPVPIPKPLEPTLKPLAPPALADVVFEVAPADADLFVDGSLTPTSTRQLAVGNHSVAVTRTGFQGREERIFVRRSASNRYSFDLQPSGHFDLRGEWSGTFDDKSCRFSVTDQTHESGLRWRIGARATVDVSEGSTQQFALNGVLDGSSGQLQLRDDAKGYTMRGKLGVEGRSLGGTARQNDVDYEYEWNLNREIR